MIKEILRIEGIRGNLLLTCFIVFFSTRPVWGPVREAAPFHR